MPLITLDYFNQQMATLGLKATFVPPAEVLTTLIAEASQWVEDTLDRVIEQRAVTEVLRGKGGNRLILDNYPVSSVTSINYVDDNGQAGSVDTSLVRILDGGILEFKNPLSGPWRTDRTYTVMYTAGYSNVPGPIKRATALKVADLLQPQYTGPKDRSVELVSNIQEQIADLLERYRRERLG